MATVRMDPYLVQWIKEWIKHQELMAEVESLGEPVVELPPTPLPWELDLSQLLESMYRDVLQRAAHKQIDLQLRRIDRQIEELGSIKAQYRNMRDLL